MENGAVSTGRRSGWFVLLALKRRVLSRSRLAKSRSFSMRPGSHLFVALSSAAGSLAWRFGCPSLLLCRLAGRDPMQLGAAMLHVDWLQGRTLGDWRLG
jgi:hypothetical protein